MNTISRTLALLKPADLFPAPVCGTIECIQRLGGMLRFYHRVAA